MLQGWEASAVDVKTPGKIKKQKKKKKERERENGEKVLERA